MCGVGGCVGNGQSTCGRSGDSDGLGGYGRLAAGGASAGAFGRRARSSGRGRGGLRENCRTLVSYAFGRLNFFCKRRDFPCGNSCGMCVSLKKKCARPAYGRPAAPCRAENACRCAAKKKYTPAPAGGITGAWRGKRRLKKYRLLWKKRPLFEKGNTSRVARLGGKTDAELRRFWRSGERGFFGIVVFVESRQKPEICIQTPNIFDIERAELLEFLPHASRRWLIGALLALYDAINSR